MRALPIMYTKKHSLLVDHTNRQLISTLDDLSSLLGRDVVGDLSAVRGVVHHQELQVLHVAHDELVQAVGEHVLGGGVGTVTNVGHQSGTTEATSAATINTLGLSPVLLHPSLHVLTPYVHSLELVSLETRERSRLLLHNLHLTNGSHSVLHTRYTTL